MRYYFEFRMFNFEFVKDLSHFSNLTSQIF